MIVALGPARASVAPPDGHALTPLGIGRHASRDCRATVVELLRLCLGQPLRDPSTVDWDDLFGMCVSERCAALAWSRGGEAIRDSAPSRIIATWRALAVASDSHGRAQLKALVEVVDTLRGRGTRPVILKGLPLAWRLYGDAGVRTSVDIDIFLPVADRNAAERVLIATSWKIVEGVRPWTQTFSRTMAGERFYLEVHSSLLDLNLHHLDAPGPRAREMMVGSVHLPAHWDAMLPSYLAAHAAKHMPASLLYDLDFHALWGSLSAAERSAAWEQAECVGLGRYLAWMVERGRALVRGAGGDRSALTVLGVDARGRTTAHALFRDLALAPSLVAAGQAVAAWVWPPHLRASPGLYARRCLLRLRGPWVRHLRRHQRYGAVVSGERSS